MLNNTMDLTLIDDDQNAGIGQNDFEFLLDDDHDLDTQMEELGNIL